MRWVLGVLGTVMCAIGLVLLFLLMQATNNRELYEQHYAWLFGLNVLVASALLLVLLWMAIRLAVRWRQRQFGSRLLLKLAAIFGLVGVVPGLLIYVVSYQFVSRSIESWFDVKVEGALSAGVNLASVTLETVANDMANNTRAASQQLAQVPDAAAGVVLELVLHDLHVVVLRVLEILVGCGVEDALRLVVRVDLVYQHDGRSAAVIADAIERHQRFLSG